MCFLHQLVPPYVALSFYSTSILGIILQIVLYSKRYEVNNVLDKLCRMSTILNAQYYVRDKDVHRKVIIFLVSISIHISGLTYYFFVQEWTHYKTRVVFPFTVYPGLHELCLCLIVLSLIFSTITGGGTCATVTLLCDITYLKVAMLIKSYRVNLKQKLNGRSLSKFINKDIKIFNAVVSLVEDADEALNLCAFLQYCMISSLIFITISIAISKEQSLSSDLVTVFTVWNFVISVYMFYQVTMSGSAVYEEGEELKKIGLEYSDEVSQQSLFISKEKDKSLMSFFLLLGSIRDNPLRVTGGGPPKRHSTMSGSAVYEEGEELKKIGLEYSDEVSLFISKENYKSFFLPLGSIRDNPVNVTGGGMFVIFLSMMTYSVVMFQLVGQ
ncbi:uncharacterized protein CDAR_370211 [Caerostris darwini]|uniref:Gustatory receptor n=1 Tax=Caerostris darwini TaxID=1538125 RepID=A0AAV4W881_9ARAC|nr:uncharacterized protein CDAR_370211 [Caerostris darwini]